MRLTKLTSFSFGKRGSSARFNWVNRGTPVALGFPYFAFTAYRNNYYWTIGFGATGMTFYRSTNGISWTLFFTYNDPYNNNQNSQNIVGFEWDAINNGYWSFFNETANATGQNRCYRIWIDAAGVNYQTQGTGNLQNYYGPSVDGGSVIFSTPSTSDPIGRISSYLVNKFTKSGNSDTTTAFSDSRDIATYPSKAINQMAYNAGTLVVVANYDLIAYTTNNGATFTNIIGTFGGANVVGVAYGASKFLAIAGNGATATSTDGVTWTTGTTLPGPPGGAGWAGTAGIAVAAGGFIVKSSNGGSSYYSTDGVTWNTQALPQNVYNNHLSGSSTLALLGVGDGSVYTST